MTIDAGIVYIFITAMLAMQGWILKEMIHNKTKIHRMEAKEEIINNSLLRIENKVITLEQKLE